MLKTFKCPDTGIEHQMRATNIWLWDNTKYTWEVYHRDAPAHMKDYWLKRYRERLKACGRERPLLRAQIKAPKPLVITVK
jgi:hypothetical protein